MENSLKGLLLAAGTVITCIVISLGFFLAREAKNTANNASGQISKLNAEFKETDKTCYEDTNITGAEVLNVISKFKDDTISIVVKTKSNNITYYNYSISGSEGKYVLGAKSTSSTQSAKNVDSKNYINPIGLFTGTMLRDENEAIIGIMFTQS